MNSIQAKQINLPSLMQRLGYQPTEIKKGGGEYWFRSPFRDEAEASFHTSYLNGKWIWNDFGDIGGTVIDFVMRHENLSRVKDALAFLDNLYPQLKSQASFLQGKGRGEQRLSSEKEAPPTFSFQQQGRKAPASDLEFLKAVPVHNPLIYSYLENERGIPRELIDRYLLQVHYRNKESGRIFFALGMKNMSEGHEIRVASDAYSFTKSSLGKKDITFIAGAETGRGKLNVFEGMLDFLSLVAMYGVNQLKGDSIILNTTQLAERASDWIKSQSYNGINAFLDNDKAGEECLESLKKSLGEKSVHTQNHLYTGYTDVNEALIDQSPKQQIKR